MVSFYKHDIPAWMDGTESLSDGAYRAYHVICQLIYLNEGPIALNERGIAGRCAQSTKAFKGHLEELKSAGKISVENGRIANVRAEKELENIRSNRENSRKGGQKSGMVRSAPDNTLKNNNSGEATLPDTRSLKEKRREEEKREESSTSDSGTPVPREAEAPRMTAAQLVDKLVEAAHGNVVHGAMGIEVAKPIYDLMSMGCDLDLDILPTITAKVASMSEPLRMWGAAWLRDAILAARQKRLDGRGKVVALPRQPETEEERKARWDLQLDTYHNKGFWPGPWGSDPDSRSCKIPPDHVKAWRLGHGLDENGDKPLPTRAASA